MQGCVSSAPQVGAHFPTMRFCSALLLTDVWLLQLLLRNVASLGSTSQIQGGSIHQPPLGPNHSCRWGGGASLASIHHACRFTCAALKVNRLRASEHHGAQDETPSPAGGGQKGVLERWGRLIMLTREGSTFLLIKPLHIQEFSSLEFALTPTDSQQPVAQRPSGGARGLLLHAAPRLASLRDLLHAPPSLSRRPRRPRLHGLPQPAEPVQPCLPQQLLQRRLAAGARRQRPPRLRGQARV